MGQPFQRFVEEHKNRLHSFAYYFLGSREEAEDVLQEVLLRLWRCWDGLDRRQLAAWTTRVTRNACIDALRRRHAYRKVVAEDGDGTAAERAAAREPDPERAAASADFRRRLEAALAELAEPHRSVLILREIQGLKYTEISSALDLPLNTVKTYIHRGRRMLRLALEEHHGETRKDVREARRGQRQLS